MNEEVENGVTEETLSENELVMVVCDGGMAPHEAIEDYCDTHRIPREAVIKYAEDRLTYSAYRAALAEIDEAFEGEDISPIFDYLHRYYG